MANKTGRNDPCPCRSGRKYKNCCLARGYIARPTKPLEWDVKGRGLSFGDDHRLARLIFILEAGSCNVANIVYVPSDREYINYVPVAGGYRAKRFSKDEFTRFMQ